MPSLAAVRCSGCGHENGTQYRFCGMCGLPLPHGEVPKPIEAKRVEIAKKEEPRPEEPKAAALLALNRTSLLGLDAEPAREPEPLGHADYLLEEIKPPRSVRMHLALAVLVAAALLMGWKWHHDGYPWIPRFAEPTHNQTLQSSNPPPAAEETPAVSENASPAPAPVPAATQKSETAPQPPAVAANSHNSDTNSSQPEEQKPSPFAEVTAKPDVRPALMDVSRTRTSPEPAPKAPDESQLLLEGEKYLYGNGVAQDCERAQKSLLAAAAHSSIAESLLGTMYASGHCAAHDLPTAYHWYARALKHDPSNTRIESDLKVLWTQMTPAERRLAGGK